MDDQEVTVPVTAGSALDQGIRWYRVRAVIALVTVIKGYGLFYYRTIHDIERDPDRPALPETGTEVRVEVPRGPDPGDVIGGTVIHRECIDRNVPDVIRREDGDTINRRNGGISSPGNGCDWRKKEEECDQKRNGDDTM